MTAAAQDVSAEPLLALASGFAPVLMIEAGVRIGLFDALDPDPRPFDDLVEATGASERGLRPLVDGLAALGLLQRREGAIGLTLLSAAYLVTSKPTQNLGGLFQQASTQLLPGWLGLAEAVRTGRPPLAVNDAAEGAVFFTEVVEGLLPMVWPAAVALADHLRIEERVARPSVLDLGAGSAAWSLAFAQRSARVSGTAVDWEPVLAATRRSVERHGCASQYCFVAGDLAEADFGRDHDVALIGHVLHSEGEARSRALLQRAFKALRPGGVVAIAEFLVTPDRSGPLAGLIFALNMLVHSQNGSTFAFEEIAGWLDEAGFAKVRSLDVAGPSPLILAERPVS